MSKKIKIGLDLDGVVAKHSLGGFWVKIRLLKEKILKKAHAKDYYYPKTVVEKTAWKIINYLRVPDSQAVAFISKIKSPTVDFYLVTSRFKFNYPSTISWLKKFSLLPLFEKVLVNVEDQNPITFKVRTIEREKIDFFVDDDLEVLTALCQTPAKLYWVVPGHRNKNENHQGKITSCQTFSEALNKIVCQGQIRKNNV